MKKRKAKVEVSHLLAGMIMAIMMLSSVLLRSAVPDKPVVTVRPTSWCGEVDPDSMAQFLRDVCGQYRDGDGILRYKDSGESVLKPDKMFLFRKAGR